ncbi:MAG TPA: hypothetical protein VFM63_08190 [Pyrinomonadaceae bacterium]|nr:hypothetical protein [Pyrinomonadaceae bacterium]
MAKLESEIDDLFRLPLAEFTGERNTLAARLKKEGRANDAERVKLLGKPPVSAWAVNQLYWDHRDAFDDLIATGKRLRPTAESRSGGRAADMRDSLDARREALVNLSDLATQVLSDAGHNPSPDTLRRVVTTLEALSAYSLLPDGPTPGRLTQDVDPPSFELMAALMSGAIAVDDDEPAPSRKAAKEKPSSPGEVRRIEEFRKKKIAAAKISLQDAKRLLADARSRVQSLETAQKKAQAQVREAEKHRRQAESLLEKATTAYDAAAEHSQGVDSDLREAEHAVDDAKRTVEETTKELESLLR